MPIFESSRKVQAFGSSLAMTLPAMFVKVNEVERGSIMNILYGLEGVMVVSKDGDIEALLKSLKAIMEKLEDGTLKLKVKKDSEKR